MHEIEIKIDDPIRISDESKLLWNIYVKLNELNENIKKLTPTTESKINKPITKNRK